MYLSLTLQDTENCNDLTDIVKKLYKLGFHYFDFQLWYDFNILVCKEGSSSHTKNLFQLKQITNIDRWEEKPNGRFYDMSYSSIMLTPSAIGLFSHAETIIPLLKKSSLTQEEKNLIINYGFFILSKEDELGVWSDLGETRGYLVQTLKMLGISVRDSELIKKSIISPLNAELMQFA